MKQLVEYLGQNLDPLYTSVNPMVHHVEWVMHCVFNHFKTFFWKTRPFSFFQLTSECILLKKVQFVCIVLFYVHCCFQLQFCQVKFLVKLQNNLEPSYPKGRMSTLSIIPPSSWENHTLLLSPNFLQKHLKWVPKFFLRIPETHCINPCFVVVKYQSNP